MQRKMTQKQLAKWLSSLPETLNIWEFNDAKYTVQQADAALTKYARDKHAASKFNEELRAIDRMLTANAESDAAENMRPELHDAGAIGHWAHFHQHLINAAGQIWEDAGRNLNAEIGRIVY